MANFAAFSLSQTMLASLKKQGYVSPSPVQSTVIPKILRGKSILAQSETGSGKTHSFLIPIIDRIDCSLPRLQSIIIAPTRELARQIYDFAIPFVDHFQQLKIRLFTSETDVSENLSGLSIAPHIIIGTPGRIADILLKKNSLRLQNVKSVVLDEADMLLELGYFDDIESLFASLDSPQIIVTSATLKQNLRDELRKFVRADFEFENEKTETASTVKHHFVDIKHQGKNNALLSFLNIRKPYLALVFASKKKTVEEAYSYLRSNKIKAIYFSGDLDERERKRAIRAIRSNDYSVIVSSDILARGMDIPDVTDVVSLDLPYELDFYYHRAGRSGRFGKDGDSWIFYDDDSTSLPLSLIDEKKVSFDFFTLKNDKLIIDPVGLLPKTKLKKKKDFISEEEKKEIKIAKANTKSEKVKPGYKKKTAYAIDRVKHKYKRKAIQKAVRRQLQEKTKGNAK